MGGLWLYATGGLLVVGALSFGLWQAKQIEALELELAASSARLEVCQKVQEVRNEIDGLSLEDLVGALTRGGSRR